MASLNEIREYVRTQTETTTSELPNATVDGYVREAFNRTLARSNRWPFFQATWELTMAAGEVSFAFPANANRAGISSLISLNGPYPYRMQMIDMEAAEDLYLGTQGTGSLWSEFSIWGDEVYLHPAVVSDQETTFVLRGHRLPDFTWMTETSEEIDGDYRLHWPLAHYAVALAYAQQEDETLEQKYMQRWQIDFDHAYAAIMEPIHDLPLTVGGGKRTYKT